jgi:hypothetical protein
MEENKKIRIRLNLESIILWILIPVCFIYNFHILKHNLMVSDTTGIIDVDAGSIDSRKRIKLVIDQNW